MFINDASAIQNNKPDIPLNSLALVSHNNSPPRKAVEIIPA
jgi:hypothetical protein